MLHDEVDRTATFAAAETFAYALCARHGEGGGALVVERAQPYVIRPSAAQMHEITYHLHYISGVNDPLHCFPVNRFHESAQNWGY